MSNFRSYGFYTKFTEESKAYVNAIPENWTWENVLDVVPAEQKPVFRLSCKLAEEWLNTITPYTLWKAALDKYRSTEHPNDFDHKKLTTSEVALKLKRDQDIVVTLRMLTHYQKDEAFLLDDLEIGSSYRWWKDAFDADNFKVHMVGFFFGTLWQYTKPHKRKYNRARNIFLQELKVAKEELYAIETANRKEEKNQALIQEGKLNQHLAESILETLPTLKMSIEVSLNSKISHTIMQYHMATWTHLLASVKVMQYTTVDYTPFVQLMESIEEKTAPLGMKLKEKRLYELAK